MGLVNDDQIPVRLLDRGANLAVLLQRVDRDDRSVELVEHVVVCGDLIAHPPDGRAVEARQRDREAGPELLLKLPQHGAGGDDENPVGPTPEDQLGGDQAGLQRLAETDVIGEQEPHPVLGQRHFDGHVLKGKIVDCSPSERQGSRRRSRRGPECRLQEQLGVNKAGRVVALEPNLRWIEHDIVVLQLNDKPRRLALHQT